MRARALRWGASLLVAGVAIGCVLVAWLAEPEPIVSQDAVDAARDAYRRAGIDASVDAEAPPGVYVPLSGGGPVEIFRTTATVDGVPVVLYLRRSDAAPVYLDDSRADGASPLLSDAAFSRLIDHLDNPAQRDLRVRNIVLTVAAAAILALAVLSLALHPDQEPS